MNKIYVHSLLAFAFLLVLLTACSDQEKWIDPPTADNEEVEVGDVWTFPRTVNVKNPNANATRVSYDDNGSSGVKQNWEWGDKFVLYNSNGDSVTYSMSSIATDHSKAIFELDG